MVKIKTKPQHFQGPLLGADHRHVQDDDQRSSFEIVKLRFKRDRVLATVEFPFLQPVELRWFGRR